MDDQVSSDMTEEDGLVAGDHFTKTDWNVKCAWRGFYRLIGNGCFKFIVHVFRFACFVLGVFIAKR